MKISSGFVLFAWIKLEILQELYELEGGEDRRKFLDELFLFMTKRRTPIARVPVRILDLEF